jgi:hypothetical protein
MRFPLTCRIYAGEKLLIGTAQLNPLVEGKSVAAGAFEPAPGYVQVRPVFQLFSESLDPRADPAVQMAKLAHYYRRRDGLKLRLETTTEQPVAIEWVHILDSGDYPADCRIEVKLKPAAPPK